jgi:hypothetical protein
VIGAGLSLLSLLAAIAAIDVRTRGQCPTAADVQQRLQPILPQGPAAAPLATDVAAVEERADGTLSISLSRSSGGLVGQRELPRAPSCADQADAVAVTLAVWEAALHPDITLALDRLPPDASRAAAPPPGPRAPPPAPAVEARAAPAPPAREPGRLRLGAGFGVAQALGGRNTFVPAARIDGAWSIASDAWRLRLSALGTGEHVMDVPPGEAHWQRLSLAAAVDRVAVLSGDGTWKMILGAGPVAGAVRLRGSGFAVDRRAFLPDLGGAAVVRLERRVGRWSAWLAVTGTWWLRSQRLEVIGATSASPDVYLPQGEAALALGVSAPVL